MSTILIYCLNVTIVQPTKWLPPQHASDRSTLTKLVEIIKDILYTQQATSRASSELLGCPLVSPDIAHKMAAPTMCI